MFKCNFLVRTPIFDVSLVFLGLLATKSLNRAQSRQGKTSLAQTIDPVLVIQSTPVLSYVFFYHISVKILKMQIIFTTQHYSCTCF